jgi:hypothetical protein
MVEYTTIEQATSEIEGADEELTEQSLISTADDDTKVDNNIDDDNLDVDHNDAKIDDDNLDTDHDDALLPQHQRHPRHGRVCIACTGCRGVVGGELRRVGLLRRGRAYPKLEDGDGGGDDVHRGEQHLEPRRSSTWSQADHGEVDVQGEVG